MDLKRHNALSAALCLLPFAAVACDYLFGTRTNIENPWIAGTSSWCLNTKLNSITGYAWYATADGLLHNENLSIFADQAMLAGQAQNGAFYALRPGLGVLAYTFFFLPTWPAINLAIATMVAVAIASVYLIGRRYSLPPLLCAMIGVVTYLLGSISFHLADYSAHIAGPATWALASFAILILRPWDRDADWRRFFLAHLTLWIVIPFNWSNFALYCALALMFLPQPRKLAISFALLAGCYVWRDVWAFVMNAAYGGSISYGATEAHYLKVALNFWRDDFQTGGVLLVAKHVIYQALETISPDPIVVAIVFSVIAFAAIRSKSPSALMRDKFLIFTLLSGMGACALVVLWGRSATARGYLAYGVPVALIIGMVVVIGKAELDRAGVRIVYAALAVLVCLQLLWVKSLTIGSPLPICQYLWAQQDLGSVFPAFVKSLANSVTFLPFGAQLQPHSLAHMNEVIADSLSSLILTLNPARLGAVDKSHRLLPSLILGSVLLLPLTIALVIGMRQPIMVGSRTIRSGVLAALSLALLWLIAWLAAPMVRKDGLTYYHLARKCHESGLVREYAITIPAGFGAALQSRGIENVELVGGFRRYHWNSLTSVELSRVGDTAAQPILSRVGLYPAEQFKKLLSPAGDATNLLLRERFTEAPVLYVGWRYQAALVEGCPGSHIQPGIELRGYNGSDQPVLFAY